MSFAVINPILIKLLFSYLVINSVASYENAYDLLERRNQRRYLEPSFRRYQTFETFSNFDDRNRYRSRDRNPFSVFVSMRPYFSKFGNGYDNLGNGIPNDHFQPFHQDYRDGLGFERRPYQRRTFNDRYDYGEYHYLRNPHRYNNYQNDFSRPYVPKFQERLPPSPRIYGNEFSSRGNSDVSKKDRFFEDNEEKKQKKTDEIYQKSQEEVNTDSVKKEKVGEQSHSDRTGENKSSLRSNKVVKKGYTTKGFASHHHKDETGNTTTFFDESSDFGGQSDIKDIADGFGTRRTLEQISHQGDEKFYKENGGQTGNYGSGLQIGNQRFEKDFSTENRHGETGIKFRDRKENEDGFGKSYRYLDGDAFDFPESHSDNYY